MFKRFDGKDRTLSQFLDEELDGEDYERGALEEVAAEADNVKTALTRLIEILHSKHIVTDIDIFYIVKGFIPEIK